VLFNVVDLNSLGLDIGALEEALIGNLPVVGETHRSVVRELLTADATLSMADVGALHGSIIIFRCVRNHSSEHKVHTLHGALGEEHPVGHSTLMDVIFEVEFSTSGHGGISVMNKLFEAWDVGDCHRGLCGLAGDVVVSNSQVVPEFVHFDAVPSSTLNGEVDTLVVLLGAQVDSDHSMDISGIRVVNVELQSEVTVAHTGNVGFHIDFSDSFTGIYGSFQVEHEIFEEGFQSTIYCNSGQADARESKFFSGVGW